MNKPTTKFGRSETDIASLADVDGKAAGDGITCEEPLNRTYLFIRFSGFSIASYRVFPFPGPGLVPEP